MIREIAPSALRNSMVQVNFFASNFRSFPCLALKDVRRLRENSRSVSRVKSNSLFIGSKRFFIPLKFVKRTPFARKADSSTSIILESEAERFFIGSQGFLNLLEFEEYQAFIGMDLRIMRIETQRLLISSQGLFIFLKSRQRVALEEMKGGLFGSKANSLFIDC